MRKNSFEIDVLIHFIRTENLTKTGNYFALNLQNVRYILDSFEKEFGCRLFQKSGNKLRATNLAKNLIPYLQDLKASENQVL